MGETVEKRLKDYKGFQILKITDNIGLRTEKTTYIAYDNEENLIDAKETLQELKKVLNNYIK